MSEDRFTAEMRRRSRHTVWASGCRSWYLDRFGNNTAIWPGSVVGYWWRTRRVDDTDFGTREFATLDCDGNLLSFFRWVAS